MGTRTGVATTADAAAIGDTVAFRPYGGMVSPYTRDLVVDPGGRGDLKTIAEAMSDATDAGLSSSNRWRIRPMYSIYTETLDIPSYVTLEMPSSNLCTINGGSTTTPMITMHGRSVIVGGNLNTTAYVCVRMVGDVTGGVPKIYGSDITASANYDGPVTCVELTGTTYSQAYAHVTHCGQIYAKNTSLGGSAKAINYRLMAGGPALEAYANHHKLSAGEDGTAGLRLAWNQSSDAYAQLNVTGDIATYSAASYYDLYSENAAAAHGGRIFCPNVGWVDEYGTPNYGVATTMTYDVGAYASSNHYRLKLLSLEATAGLTLRGTAVSPTAARTTAAVALAASTTVALPSLSLPVAAGETWDVEYFAPITVSGGTAGITPKLTLPAGTTGFVQTMGTTTTTITVANVALTTNVTSGAFGTFLTASFTGWIRVRSVLTFANAGSLDFGVVTGASAAGSVLANASLRAVKV